MKPVPIIFLLCLGSLIGCSGQSEQSTASNEAGSQERKIAEQPSNETDTAESTAIESQSGPPPAMGYAPGSDQASAPSGATTAQPETTGGLPIVEKAKELVPVSWWQTLQRARFWDITNRVVSERNKQPADFDDAEARELANAFQRMDKFFKRVSWLHELLKVKQRFPKSELITQQLTASLRGELELPEGTRQRRNRLKDMELPGSREGGVQGLERRLLEDRLGKGDLFELAVRLRGSIANFVKLRELENIQDEFFLSFPTTRLRELDLTGDLLGQSLDPPSATIATVRELWAEVPPELKAPNPYFGGSMFPEREDRITALPVMDKTELEKLLTLTDRIEELSGGPEPLLTFPDKYELPLRTRLVTASQRNLDAIRKADEKAFADLRDKMVNQLDDEDKEKIKEPFLDSDEEALEYLIKEVTHLSDNGLARALDLTARLKVDPKPIIEKYSFEIGADYVNFVKKRRHEVMHVGATYYFSSAK